MPPKPTIKATCPYCEREFSPLRHQVKDGKQPFCSRPCFIAGKQRKHGMAHSPEYRIWAEMRSRCTNPSRPHYDRYGGRGIAVCPEWSSFEQFYADMGPRPSPTHTVDRIDNDGPYSAENCRWATKSQQQRNRSDSIILTHQGRTMTISDWAEELGMKRNTLGYRYRHGLTPAEILDPVINPSGRNGKRRYVPDGGYQQGEQRYNAKLTEVAVRAIRSECESGELHGIIAARHGIARQTVSKISHRKSWKHVV